jgi:hypothetical protein
MLPGSWAVRLVDCNTASITDGDFAWADLVFTGGMLAATVRHAAADRALSLAGLAGGDWAAPIPLRARTFTPDPILGAW